MGNDGGGAGRALGGSIPESKMAGAIAAAAETMDRVNRIGKDLVDLLNQYNRASDTEGATDQTRMVFQGVTNERLGRMATLFDEAAVRMDRINRGSVIAARARAMRPLLARAVAAGGTTLAGLRNLIVKVDSTNLQLRRVATRGAARFGAKRAPAVRPTNAAQAMAAVRRNLARGMGAMGRRAETQIADRSAAQAATDRAAAREYRAAQAALQRL